MHAPPSIFTGCTKILVLDFQLYSLISFIYLKFFKKNLNETDIFISYCFKEKQFKKQTNFDMNRIKNY